MSQETVTIGACQLIRGDCLEVLPTRPPVDRFEQAECALDLVRLHARETDNSPLLEVIHFARVQAGYPPQGAAKEGQ